MKYQTLNAALSPRLSQKVIRSASKRSPDPYSCAAKRCEESDHSNDSGLGLDHQLEVQLATRTNLPYTATTVWCEQEPQPKRRKLTFNYEPEEVNDDFCFPEVLRRNTRSPSPKSNMPGRGRGMGGATITLSSPLSGTSRDGKSQLVIVCQPEAQHRARYQTEGSRGAVKDRTGNGFPVVKLVGYTKPTTLQVFIGTDIGRVAPHMFYQACRVSGKNSTPCVERKIDGTVVIEVDLDPSKDMTVTCDCVGILKERNVDVEHRFPEQTGSRNKKKSTRCRIVFRASTVNSDGSSEVLQVCSQPIVCTQPPGVPEICKKSLTSCPATGGCELFVLGKNFLKDTRVVFQQSELHPPWEETVIPDKEFLQQTHLVCVVPPYRSPDITEPVTVRVIVTSSGKASDPHTLVYLPAGSPMMPAHIDGHPGASYLQQAFVNGNRVFGKGTNLATILPSAAPLSKPHGTKLSYFEAIKKDVDAMSMMWPQQGMTKPETDEEEDNMMPPPPALIPIASRRPSHPLTEDGELKAELVDEASQASLVDRDDSDTNPSPTDLSMKTPVLRQLVEVPPSINPLANKPLFYSDQSQFLEEALLRPPPAKISAREFSDNVELPSSGFLRGPGVSAVSLAHTDVDMVNESSQSGYDGGRTRSGSFSNSPSSSGFEGYTRVRASSFSHSHPHADHFAPSPSVAPYEARSAVPPGLGVYDTVMPVEPTPLALPLASEGTVKDISSAVSSVAVPDMQPLFYCQADTVQSSTSAQTTMCPDIISTSAQTRNLDAFVNSAAESHISPKRDAYEAPTVPVTYATPLAGKNIITTSYETMMPVTDIKSESSTVELLTVPVPIQELQTVKPATAEGMAVKQMEGGAQKIGDMVLPPGPAPPLTGMVPQEMVKMTDNDLISYINPSCFDQGEVINWWQVMCQN